MKKIPFIDLASQQQRIRENLQERMEKVLAHGQYILGPEVKELEQKLAEYVGVKHCITCANGTDAIELALMALGIGAGDEVITSPFTFVATAEAIALVGAKPVFVDIDKHTYNIDPDLIEAAITDRTKAIMPVSLYGQCADFDKINEVAVRYNLPVIEDAAQSFGATYKGRKSCALSTLACTSFFPSKPLGCYGDGGALFTNDDELANILGQIRVHGQGARYIHTAIGRNSRLDTLQAAVLLAKMDILDSEIAARIRIGARYSSLLKDKVVTPFIEEFNTSVYAQYSVLVANRAATIDKLGAAGVPTAVHYPMPLHLQPAYSYLGYAKGDFPVAENYSDRIMSLPMSAELDDKTMDYILANI